MSYIYLRPYQYMIDMLDSNPNKYMSIVLNYSMWIIINSDNIYYYIDKFY